MRAVRTSTASALRTLVETLLAVAFLVSCILLAAHALTADKVEFNVAGELLLVAVLALEGIVAVRHLGQARLDSTHTVLVSVLEDYRTAEMMLSINSLWRFRREHGEQFVEAYLDRWRKDDERIASLPAENQLQAISATLHYRRRVVKEFYNLLAGLHDLGVLPKQMLHTYFSEAELKIIPEILIPLETAVAKQLRTEGELGGWFDRLQRLYEGRQR